MGSGVIASISLYRDPRTGTQYVGNWASRVRTYGTLKITQDSELQLQ